MSLPKPFLNDMISYIKRVYEENANKNLHIERSNCQLQIKVSKNQVDALNHCLTSYLTLNNYKFPRLYNDETYKSKNFTQYYFNESEQLVIKKIHDFSGLNNRIIECFYLYKENENIRLSFKGNALTEIHCCLFSNNRLANIINAVFDSIEGLQTISGEIYEYENSKISSCINYYNYSLKQPMFIKREMLNRTIVINPMVIKYSMVYNGDEFLECVNSDTHKPCNISQVVSKLIAEINMCNNTDKYILW